MLGPRLITGFVLDEFIVDKADAVTGEYSQDLTVAFTLRYHGVIRLSDSLVRLLEMLKIARKFQSYSLLCAVAWQQPLRAFGFDDSGNCDCQHSRQRRRPVCCWSF